MSAEIQTRKRKDKKRRKEDEGSPFQPTVPLVTNNNHSSTDDVTIHVHKEGGLGGGICAKLVFFVLFSALAVLIGLIITEHRGLTDVEVGDTNSKFSQIFEGWTDSNVDHHEDDLEEIEDVLSEEHGDHNEEEELEADISGAENEEEHERSDEDADTAEDDDRDEEDNKTEEKNEDVDEDDDEEEDRSINEEDSAENDYPISQEQLSVEQDKYDDESAEADDEDRQESEENEEDDEDNERKYSAENISEEDKEQVSEEKENVENEDDELDKLDDDDRDDDNADQRYKSDEDEQEESEEQNISEEDYEKEESREPHFSEEEDDLDRPEKKILKDNLNKKEEDDDDEDEAVNNERFVRKASKKASDEDEDDHDDEANKESTEHIDTVEDKEPEIINAQREPDDNVQESSGSPSQIHNAVGEAHGSVTKNVSNTQQKRRHEIDDAHDAIEYNPAYAVKLFDKILKKFPSSPRSVYGKALALNRLADQKRSNDILYNAIELYTKVLNMPDVSEALYKEAVEKTIKVMRFVGQYRNLLEIHRLAFKRFPNDPKYYNELVVTYLTINRIEEARPVLKEVLKKWPNDGFALVHHGFILKTADNKLEEAVDYLKRGIATNDIGVVDGRFYFHLGDALERLGKHEEAMQVYEEGTKNKLFLSKYQRSLYNVKRLTGKPLWEEQELPYSDLFRELQQHWKKIRDEGLSVLNGKGYFQDESENLRDTGDWKQFELFARGQKNTKNCAKSPFTCNIIEKIPEAKGCKRGQTKFSVMHPGTHVWPHCGPTNCRLRVHLGLKVPPKTFLRVAEEYRTWNEGEILIFDDSFEHEVWHNGTALRLILIVDIWHPELSASEKRNLSPI